MASNGILRETLVTIGNKQFNLYNLRVTVVEIKGRSVCGMKVGDSFEIRHSNQLHLPPEQHFCMFALAAILPLLPAKQRKLDSNDWLETDSLIACPDPDEQVIMHIERLDKVTLNATELT